ncbi:MAG: hypothetical protein QM781_03180 [Chitinophagaceae bacterium]
MKKLPLTKWMKWLGTLAGLGLIVAGFQPWVHVVSKDLWLSGVDTTGANFGLPIFNLCYYHFFFCSPGYPVYGPSGPT